MSTIARVAALAGVGVGTVSRVLNDSGSVSAPTRARVLEAIAELEFEPSATARALSTGRTLALGVVAPFLTEPSVVERLRGVTHHLSGAGYQVVLFDVERPEQAEEILRSLAASRRVDGLLVVSLPLAAQQLARLEAARIPVVMIDRRLDGVGSVYTDDTAGGRLATEHLLALGHRRVAFLGDDEQSAFGFTSSRLRREGYAAALCDAGLAPHPDLVRTGPHRRDAARQLAHELLRLPAPPTAVFAASDHQALGVLEAAETAGVPVPERLSVVGYDDVELARYAGLSTIAQPLEASGARGAELLLDAVGGAPPRSQELRLELRVRETSGPAPGGGTHAKESHSMRTPLLNAMMRESI